MLTEAPVLPSPTSSDSRGSSAQDKPASEKPDTKFKRGNPGGPGNPYARHTAALRNAIHKVLTTEEMEELARCWLEMARQGDHVAGKLLMTYGIGKPSESVNPDTLDLEEWQLFRQGALRADAAGDVINSLPVSHVLRLCRAIIPIVSECITQEVVKGLRGEPNSILTPQPARPARPTEEVVQAPSRMPNLEDVLPKRQKRRKRQDRTGPADAVPVVPPMPPPSAEKPRTDSAGERGGVSPPVQSLTGGLTPPGSPAEGCSAAEDEAWSSAGEPVLADPACVIMVSAAGMDFQWVDPPASAGLAPAAAEPVAEPTIPAAPVAPTPPHSPAPPPAYTENSTSSPDSPRSTPAVPVVQPTPPAAPLPAEQASQPTGTPAAAAPPSVAQLQWLLRLLGVNGTAPPSPNGDNGRAQPPEGDDEGP